MGAARFLRGLAEVVDPERLTVVVNTGDDDTFYGLHVSPDIDTIVYTLAGLAPRGRGWGIRGDRHQVERALALYYGEPWFHLGDRDLATHIYRTDLLRRGLSLSECTRRIARSLGIRQTVLPASDEPVRTFIFTRSGRIPFQQYLVKYASRPAVQRISYAGARKAEPAPGVIEAIEEADAILIAPSNPLVSIAPILSVPAIGRAVRRARGRCVAISPLIRGRAVKGPLDRMLRQLGERAGTAAIARRYRGFARALVVEPGDVPARRPIGIEIHEHPTLLARPAAARRVARFAVELATAER